MTKKRLPADKRPLKEQQLITRAAAVLSCSEDEARPLLSQGLVQSVRLNPLVGDAAATLYAMKDQGWTGTAVGWCKNGYTIETGFETLRDSSLVTEGKIYIQNQSSWLPVVALNPQPGEAILDLCAAPGGKTSHIAALMQGSGRLVANDNSRPRLAKLRRNLERLGASAEYTLTDATRYSRYFNETFDKILLDAPCSGEGLIDLHTPKTLDSWSVAHIRRLATLQKRLIEQAWRLLAPDGRLVYSTCTMAPEENEAVIDWLLRRHDDAKVNPLPFKVEGQITPVTTWNESRYNSQVNRCCRIAPSGGSEAFFVCILEKKVNND